MSTRSVAMSSRRMKPAPAWCSGRRSEFTLAAIPVGRGPERLGEPGRRGLVGVRLHGARACLAEASAEVRIVVQGQDRGGEGGSVTPRPDQTGSAVADEAAGGG